MKGAAAIVTVALALVGVFLAAGLTFSLFVLWRAEPGSAIEPFARIAAGVSAALTLACYFAFPLLLSVFIDKGGPALVGGRPLATFKARALARVFDVLCVLLPLTQVVTCRLNGGGGLLFGEAGNTAFAAAALVLNNGLLEWVGGTSVGKFLFKVQVVSMDGGPLTPKQALVRNLARFVDNLILFPAGVLALLDSPLRQRLGDKWAKTIVVKAGTSRTPRPAP